MGPPLPAKDWQWLGGRVRDLFRVGASDAVDASYKTSPTPFQKPARMMVFVAVAPLTV